MGFRSTITTQHYGFKWPEWFKDKYPWFIFPSGSLVCSKYESKFYNNEVFEDMQKAIDWPNFPLNFVCAILHEDGSISKVIITKDKIIYWWMDDGCEADNVWVQ